MRTCATIRQNDTSQFFCDHGARVRWAKVQFAYNKTHPNFLTLRIQTTYDTKKPSSFNFFISPTRHRPLFPPSTGKDASLYQDPPFGNILKGTVPAKQQIIKTGRKSSAGMPGQKSLGTRKRRSSRISSSPPRKHRGKQQTSTTVAPQPLAFAAFRENPIAWFLGEDSPAVVKRVILSKMLISNAVLTFSRLKLLAPWQEEFFKDLTKLNARCFQPYVITPQFIATCSPSGGIQIFREHSSSTFKPLRSMDKDVQSECGDINKDGMVTDLKVWPLDGKAIHTEARADGTKLQAPIGLMRTTVATGHAGMSVMCTATLATSEKPNEACWAWRGVLRHRVKPSAMSTNFDRITGFIHIPSKDQAQPSSIFIYGPYGVADIIPVHSGDYASKSPTFRTRVSRLRTKAGLSRFTWSNAGVFLQRNPASWMSQEFDPYGTILAAAYIDDRICLTMVPPRKENEFPRKYPVFILEINPITRTIERFGSLSFRFPVIAARFYSLVSIPNHVCWMPGLSGVTIHMNPKISSSGFAWLIEKKPQGQWLQIKCMWSYFVQPNVCFYDMSTKQKSTDLLLRDTDDQIHLEAITTEIRPTEDILWGV